MKTVTAMITEPEKIEFIEQELPVLKENEVLIRMDSVGLCHTDLPRFLGQQAFGISKEGYRQVQEVQYPCTVGHEPVGTIVEVGKKVTKFSVGDKVSGNFDAAFTTYRIVSENNLIFKLPELPFDYRLCVAEPIGCVINIINACLTDPVKYAGVVGCGVMGLMTIAGLKAAGVQHIIAIDVVDEKLELAKKYGASGTINSIKENLVDAIYTMTDGHFLDSIVEITGSLKGLQSACSVIKFPREKGLLYNPFTGRGRIIMSSVYTKQEQFPQTLANELVLRAPILDAAHPASGKDVLKNDLDGVKAMINGAIPMDKMITHKIPFSRLEEGFQWLKKAPEGYLKGIALFD